MRRNLVTAALVLTSCLVWLEYARAEIAPPSNPPQTGSGGGIAVGSSGGTTNAITKFDSSDNLVDSCIVDASGTVTATCSGGVTLTGQSRLTTHDPGPTCSSAQHYVVPGGSGASDLLACWDGVADVSVDRAGNQLVGGALGVTGITTLDGQLIAQSAAAADGSGKFATGISEVRVGVDIATVTEGGVISFDRPSESGPGAYVGIGETPSERFKIHSSGADFMANAATYCFGHSLTPANTFGNVPTTNWCLTTDTGAVKMYGDPGSTALSSALLYLVPTAPETDDKVLGVDGTAIDATWDAEGTLAISGDPPSTAAADALIYLDGTAGGASDYVLYSEGSVGDTHLLETGALSVGAGLTSTNPATANANGDSSNHGVLAIANGATEGTVIGISGRAENASSAVGAKGIGVSGQSYASHNDGRNAGVIGTAINAGTNGSEVGGFFGLCDFSAGHGLSLNTSAGLIVDNCSESSSPIMILRTGGAVAVTTAGDGATTMTKGLTLNGATNAELTITGGTLTAATSALMLTSTLPSSGDYPALYVDVATSASHSGAQFGAIVSLGSGYNGANNTIASYDVNDAAGTGTSLAAGGNVATLSYSRATTTGTNTGAHGRALNGDLNLGISGLAINDKASAWNVGSLSLGLNDGASGIGVAAAAILYAGTDRTVVTGILTEDSALTVSNHTAASNILTLKDNTTTVVTVANGGATTISASLDVASTLSVGTCMLNGGATATCTETVTAGCTPTCSDTEAGVFGVAAVACSVSSTTITITSATTLDTSIVSYHCL